MHIAFIILLTVHILAAVTGFGPMFQTGIIRRTAGNLLELQHSMNILKRTGKAPKHSLVVVLLTGAALVGLVHLPGYQGWLLISAVLLFVLAAFLFYIFPSLYDQADAIVTEAVKSGSVDEIPVAYRPIDKRLRIWENVSLVIVAAIFLLMITQPF